MGSMNPITDPDDAGSGLVDESPVSEAYGVVKSVKDSLPEVARVAASLAGLPEIMTVFEAKEAAEAAAANAAGAASAAATGAVNVLRGELGDPIGATHGGSLVALRDNPLNRWHNVKEYVGYLMGSAGATVLGYQHGSLHSVDRTIADRLSDRASVLDFFTKAERDSVRARDGLVDHTAAIQRAITQLSLQGGTLYFPDGQYNLNDKLVIPFTSGWRIHGQSRSGTVLKQFTSNRAIFSLEGDTSNSWLIEELTFTWSVQQNNTHTQSIAIAFNAVASANGIFNWQVRRCIFDKGFRSISGVPGNGIPVWGVWIGECNHQPTMAGALFHAVPTPSIGQPAIKIVNNYIHLDNCTEEGIRISEADNFLLMGNEFNGGFQGVNPGCKAVYISGSFGSLISCKAEHFDFGASGGSLFDFYDSNVSLIGCSANGVRGSDYPTLVSAGGTNGRISIDGFFASDQKTAGVALLYGATQIGLVRGVQLTSARVSTNNRAYFGPGQSRPRFDLDARQPDALTDIGDQSINLNANSDRVQTLVSTLTANRVITLPAVGCYDGMEFEIVRGHLLSDSGNFALTVSDPLSAQDFTFPPNSKGFVRYRCVGGGSWRLVASSLVNPIDLFGTASVRDFGAKGDNAADDTAAFQRAAASNRPAVIPAGTYRINGDVTFTAHVTLMAGAKLVRVSGTLALSGGMTAPVQQVFEGYIHPNIDVNNTATPEGWVDWFGYDQDAIETCHKIFRVNRFGPRDYYANRTVILDQSNREVIGCKGSAEGVGGTRIILAGGATTNQPVVQVGTLTTTTILSCARRLNIYGINTIRDGMIDPVATNRREDAVPGWKVVGWYESRMEDIFDYGSPIHFRVYGTISCTLERCGGVRPGAGTINGYADYYTAFVVGGYAASFGFVGANASLTIRDCHTAGGVGASRMGLLLYGYIGDTWVEKFEDSQLEYGIYVDGADNTGTPIAAITAHQDVRISECVLDAHLYNGLTIRNINAGGAITLDKTYIALNAAGDAVFIQDSQGAVTFKSSDIICKSDVANYGFRAVGSKRISIDRSNRVRDAQIGLRAEGVSHSVLKPSITRTVAGGTTALECVTVARSEVAPGISANGAYFTGAVSVDTTTNYSEFNVSGIDPFALTVPDPGSKIKYNGANWGGGTSFGNNNAALGVEVTISGGGAAGSPPTLRGTSSNNGASTVTVALPAGSAAGDDAVLIACGGNIPTGVPAGWAAIDRTIGNGWSCFLFFKTLDAEDITAGSITVTFAGSFSEFVAIVSFVGATGGIDFIYNRNVVPSQRVYLTTGEKYRTPRYTKPALSFMVLTARADQDNTCTEGTSLFNSRRASGSLQVFSIPYNATGTNVTIDIPGDGGYDCFFGWFAVVGA